MATYTDNYQLTKPTYAEVADVQTFNNNMTKIDEIMHSSQISLAPAYDPTQTYNAGDVVMYELLMYECQEDAVTGVWDPTKWERTTAGEHGGGSDVEPNPTGTPTATLTKLGIDGTVFEIPSGGGGSSGEVIITGQERVVGTYNNKPLYQLDIQADDITGNVNITQAPTSIGRLVSYNGCAYDRTNNQYVALPLYATSSYYMRLYIYNGYIYMEIASSVRVDASLSLRYTKTTD